MCVFCHTYVVGTGESLCLDFLPFSLPFSHSRFLSPSVFLSPFLSLSLYSISQPLDLSRMSFSPSVHLLMIYLCFSPAADVMSNHCFCQWQFHMARVKTFFSCALPLLSLHPHSLLITLLFISVRKQKFPWIPTSTPTYLPGPMPVYLTSHSSIPDELFLLLRPFVHLTPGHLAPTSFFFQ